MKDKEVSEEWASNYFKSQLTKMCSYLHWSRSVQLRYLIMYNVMFFALYFYHNYVLQKDYSNFNMSRLEDKLDKLQSLNLNLDFQLNDDKIRNKLLKMFDKMNDSPFDDDGKKRKEVLKILKGG